MHYNNIIGLIISRKWSIVATFLKIKCLARFNNKIDFKHFSDGSRTNKQQFTLPVPPSHIQEILIYFNRILCTKLQHFFYSYVSFSIFRNYLLALNYTSFVLSLDTRKLQITANLSKYLSSLSWLQRRHKNENAFKLK